MRFLRNHWCRCLATGLFLASLLSLRGAEARLAFSDISRPEFFPILPWDPYHGWNAKAQDIKTNGLETIADCHFNMAGFALPKDLPQCRKLGLGAIVLPTDEVHGPEWFQQWKDLPDEQIDLYFKNFIKTAGSNPAVKGFFIKDEPGVRDFPALGKAVAAVKKYAPGKLAYINLFPDYATLGAPDKSQLGTENYTEYLEKFVEIVKPQMISYDNYMVQYSHDFKDPGTAASYFRNLLEVRRVAQKHHLPYLNIVAANQLDPNRTIPSPANLLLQAYTTLAAGYRGVTWYTYYGRGYNYAPIDNDGRKTLTWGYLGEVNRQVATLAPILCRLSSTGVYFSAPPIVPGLPLLPGRLVESVESTTPMMVGEFSDNSGGNYVMLVNLSLERTANLRFKTKIAGQRIQVVSAMDGSLGQFEQDKSGFWMVAGQGVLLKFGR